MTGYATHCAFKRNLLQLARVGDLLAALRGAGNVLQGFRDNGAPFVVGLVRGHEQPRERVDAELGGRLVAVDAQHPCQHVNARAAPQQLQARLGLGAAAAALGFARAGGAGLSTGTTSRQHGDTEG